MIIINLKKIFYFLKIHHSIKNIVIFLPLLASHQIINLNYNQLFFFFINISFLSTIIYCHNNIHDYEFDLKNKKLNYSIDQTKKNLFYIFIFITFLVQISILKYLDQKIWFICLFYFILAFLYNIYLKKIKYLDIITICIFHMLRIFYGSIAFSIDLSYYFLIFFTFVFIMIAINKRISEIKLKYLNRPYNLNDLKILYPLQICCALISVMTFALYILNPVSNSIYNNNILLFVNLIIFSLMVVNFILHQKKYNMDVVVFFYKNKTNFFLTIIFLFFYYKNSLFF